MAGSITTEDKIGGEEGYYVIEDVEDLNQYQPGGHHPMSIGDTLCEGRYQVVHKLGKGGYSLTWLARDNKANRYVAVKVLTANVEDNHEQEIIKKLSKALVSDPEGQRLCSVLLNSFTLIGPNGSHRCLVMDPARMNLNQAKNDSPVSYTPGFPAETARAVMGQLVQAVAKLHQAGIVHGDLHPGNVLFYLPDSLDALSIEQLNERVGEPETENVERIDGKPLDPFVPAKVVFPVWLGIAPENLEVREAGIFLCDFGEAYTPATTARHVSNTLKLNRPPEARFSDKPLTFSSDIWTLGCLLFQVLAVGPLFKSMTGDPDAIAKQQVQACGKFPEEWWQKWEKRSKDFKEDGTPISGKVVGTLESRVSNGFQSGRTFMDLEPVDLEEQEDFLEILSRIMVLEPEKRATIEEVMQSTWFTRWALPAVSKVEYPEVRFREPSVLDNSTAQEVGPSNRQSSVTGAPAATMMGWWTRLWNALIGNFKLFWW